MNKYFAYVRVSTTRQGEQGVSLQQQREAIERFAARNNLTISEWFEEQETAAKRGRPHFNRMLSLLRAHKAGGVIIHKIDRSARNLKDWAELGELSETGIEVRFANESLDLNSRGGRLSADIQAVVAADFVRNLREETKKGFYGRLKQGLYPMPAPFGYLDAGPGNPKIIDPANAPTVKKTFELYATGKYTQLEVVRELNRLSARAHRGKTITLKVVAKILSNPFYSGEVWIKKTNQVFPGLHQPLISRALFETVQQVLSGKTVVRSKTHRFPFSRLISCRFCGRSLIGEVQKGHVYYRCHQPHSTILAGRAIEEQFSSVFDRLKLLPKEEAVIDALLESKRRNREAEERDRLKAFELRLVAVDQRIERLTDAYLEGAVDRPLFEQKKTALALERREITAEIAAMHSGNAPHLSLFDEIVELIKTAYPLYKSGDFEEKRRMVQKVMSNRVAEKKTLDFSVRFPFSEIAQRNEFPDGSPPSGLSRTWELILQAIGKSLQDGQLEAYREPLNI